MKSIENILLEIISLLRDNQQNEWEKTFNFFLISATKYGKNAIRRDILAVYGGMGSFNDLILYKNGNLNIKDNIKLDILRNELFTLIK